jgi:hypothetical protein
VIVDHQGQCRQEGLLSRMMIDTLASFHDQPDMPHPAESGVTDPGSEGSQDCVSGKGHEGSIEMWDIQTMVKTPVGTGRYVLLRYGW